MPVPLLLQSFLEVRLLLFNILSQLIIFFSQASELHCKVVDFFDLMLHQSTRITLLPTLSTISGRSRSLFLFDKS